MTTPAPEQKDPDAANNAVSPSGPLAPGQVQTNVAPGLADLAQQNAAGVADGAQQMETFVTNKSHVMQNIYDQLTKRERPLHSQERARYSQVYQIDPRSKRVGDAVWAGLPGQFSMPQ